MLNATQKATLLADINADAGRQAQLAAGQDQALADYYNGATAFDGWRSRCTIDETGQVFVGTEWAGMTGANHVRLQTIAQYFQNTGYDPSKTDIRAMFNDIWSGAGGTNTRAALAVLWKKKLTVLQKLLSADGDADNVWTSEIGSDAQISPQEISSLRV